MSNNPFRPIKVSDKPSSIHPRTLTNRRNTAAKAGLALSDHRDDAAFRVSKSRHLRKLHQSKEWAALSREQQLIKEKNIVAMLERKREEKKLNHMIKWSEIEESNEGQTNGDEDPENDTNNSEETIAVTAQENEIDDDDNDSWVSLSSNDSETKTKTFREVRAKSFAQWNEKLEHWKSKFGVTDEKWKELEKMSAQGGGEM